MVQGSLEAPFTMQEGLIQYKGRIWIGNNILVQQQLLQELHAGAIGGHSWVQATYNRVIRLFA